MPDIKDHFLKASPEDVDTRLDVFVTAHVDNLPSRTFVQKLIEQGYVTVNEEKEKANYKIEAGDDIHIRVPKTLMPPSEAAAEDIALDIFYEDDAIIVVNKASGMLVHPAVGRFSGTLVNAVLHHSQKLSDMNTAMRPGIVHRLDEDTSGLIVVAKDNIAHAKLARQFEKHEIFKKYVALVEGLVAFDEGLIDVPIGRDNRHREKKAVSYDDNAREAVTRYRVIRRFPKKKVTLIGLYPKTGRTHQLRVHMKHLGHPILGDPKYGRESNFPRLALHAQSLGFKHPRTNKWIEFSCLPPKEFLELS